MRALWGMGELGMSRIIYCHDTKETFTQYRQYLKSSHWDAVKFRLFSARSDPRVRWYSAN